MSKQTTNLVSVDSLIFEDNVRTNNCMNLPKMVDSIKRNGFKVNHPLVVSAKEGGRFLVLCGNRRGRALCFLRDNESETFKRVLPSGRVPAIIHEGLTTEEEVLLRIDHSTDEDREPLDEWSQFLAIKQLVGIASDGEKETQDSIATKLGIFHFKGKNQGKPNRSFVQPRISLAKLPSFVQDMMRQQCEKPDSVPLRWRDVPSLYKAWNVEFADYPNGDGPLFRAEWEKIVNSPVLGKGKASAESYSCTAADARKRAQVVNSPLVRDILLAATGQGKRSLADCDKAAVELENDGLIIRALRAYHGEGVEQQFSEAIAAYTDSADEVVATE